MTLREVISVVEELECLQDLVRLFHGFLMSKLLGNPCLLEWLVCLSQAYMSLRNRGWVPSPSADPLRGTVMVTPMRPRPCPAMAHSDK